jgi:Xaa-Pro dipeptidase
MADTGTDLRSSSNFSDHLAQLQTRWEGALEATGFDMACISAGVAQNYFLDDQAPPFRPNPHFAQWFPDGASQHCELIVRPGRRPTLLFFQPADYWHAPPVTPAWAGTLFDLQVHHDLDSLRKSLSEQMQGHNNVAHIGPTSDLAAQVNSNPAPLLSQLDFARARKTAFEIAAVRAATAAAVAGHQAAATAFHQSQSEYDIYMAFLAATGNTGAELPYASIVALNEHAGVLHYQHYERAPPAQRNSFLIDAGASAYGYASDVTRTYTAQAQQPADEAQQVYGYLLSRLDSAQQQLIEEIRTGASYEQLHAQMLDTIAALLVDAGVLLCSVDRAISQRLADPFMPHGLGHLIGLQTHDVGGQLASPEGGVALPSARFSALRLTRTLELDALFTIEPGIYFIPMLLDELRVGAAASEVNWSLVDALLPYGGIRIEDNVWLTAAGPVNITREAFAVSAGPSQ